MSQWTHVCGCIRFDAIRIEGLSYNTLSQIKELVSENVPCGSEGGLGFSFWDNPEGSAMAAFNVAVFGDLRNFGKEDVPEIEKWFNRVTTTKDVMIRNAIIEICVEYEKEPIILRYTHPEVTE